MRVQNDFLKYINLLNKLRKEQCPELSLKIKFVFSNIKDKNDLDKHQKDVNARKKNFCNQKYNRLL